MHTCAFALVLQIATLVLTVTMYFRLYALTKYLLCPPLFMDKQVWQKGF